MGPNGELDASAHALGSVFFGPAEAEACLSADAVQRFEGEPAAPRKLN
jgi:hypothetical protein